MTLLLFNVEISALIIKFVIKRQESAWSHSDKERVNSPIISFVIPSTVSNPEFKNCFGARYPTLLFSLIIE